jgi:putative oxidoreductase
MTVLRIAVACLLAAHGWHRVIIGGVVEFGDALNARHIPFGMAVAHFVTGMEVLATIPLALGRQVFPLASTFVAIYTCAIFVHHWKHGWFTSGSGEDGCEFPTLLVLVLLTQAWAHAPRWRAQALAT